MGGKVTGGSPIPAEHGMPMYNEIIKTLASLLKISTKDMKPLGSTGKKKKGTFSGDIDIAIDGILIGANNKLKFDEIQDFIFKKMNSKFKNTVNMKGLGIVSFLYPIPDSDDSGQVDLMITDDIEITNFVMHSPNFINNESKYKGLYRTHLIYNTVKNIDTDDVDEYFEDGDVKTFTKYSLTPRKGLIKQLKSFEGKLGKLKKAKVIGTDEVITTIPLDIVKFIFGEQYQVADMNSFESIYKIVSSSKFKHKDKFNKIMEDFKNDIIKTKKLPLPSEIR